MSTETLSTHDDFVARLADLAPDGAVTALRANRADATRHTQGSLDALLDADLEDFPLAERLAAAAFASTLAHADEVARAYRDRLLALGDSGRDAATLLDRFAATATHGDGAPASAEGAEPGRLATILAHTHAVTETPAQTAINGPAALATLRRAGLSTRAIVTLSQLVAFVAYQVRVVAALRALEGRA